MTAAAKKIEEVKPKTLTQQIKECQAKKLRMQIKQQEAATITTEHQKIKDRAEAEETRLTMEHLMAPSDELAIAAKDARIQTEACIRQYEESCRMLRNIPDAVKTLVSELRTLEAAKKTKVREVVDKKIGKETAGLETKAKRALAALTAHNFMKTGMPPNGANSEATFAYLNKSQRGHREDIARMITEEYAKIVKKFNLEEI